MTSAGASAGPRRRCSWRPASPPLRPAVVTLAQVGQQPTGEQDFAFVLGEVVGKREMIGVVDRGGDRVPVL